MILVTFHEIEKITIGPSNIIIPLTSLLCFHLEVFGGAGAEDGGDGS